MNNIMKIAAGNRAAETDPIFREWVLNTFVPWQNHVKNEMGDIVEYTQTNPMLDGNGSPVVGISNVLTTINNIFTKITYDKWDNKVQSFTLTIGDPTAILIPNIHVIINDNGNYFWGIWATDATLWDGTYKAIGGEAIVANRGDGIINMTFTGSFATGGSVEFIRE